MHKNTTVKISSISQRQKLPDGIRIRLENHYFPNWKQEKNIFLDRNSQKRKNEGKSFNGSLRESHRAENLKEFSQNVSFLVKIEMKTNEKVA